MWESSRQQPAVAVAMQQRRGPSSVGLAGRTAGKRLGGYAALVQVMEGQAFPPPPAPPHLEHGVVEALPPLLQRHPQARVDGLKLTPAGGADAAPRVQGGGVACRCAHRARQRQQARRGAAAGAVAVAGLTPTHAMRACTWSQQLRIHAVWVRAWAHVVVGMRMCSSSCSSIHPPGAAAQWAFAALGRPLVHWR